MTSVDSPFSLHDVGERGVSVHWDEAVAIVEELCEVAIAASGDAAPVPALEDVLIGSDGSVTLRRTKGDKNPSAAGRVLHTLLGNGDVPMPLRLFVTQSIVQGTHSSLREFARGLGYFGKPSRQQLIQDVYARCAQAGQRAANAPPVQPPPPLPKSESELAEDRRPQGIDTQACDAPDTCRGNGWPRGRCRMDLEEWTFRSECRGSAERMISEAAAVLADLGKQVRDTISPTAAPAPSVAERRSQQWEHRAEKTRVFGFRRRPLTRTRPTPQSTGVDAEVGRCFAARHDHSERRGLGASRGIRTAQGPRARVGSRVFERR